MGDESEHAQLPTDSRDRGHDRNASNEVVPFGRGAPQLNP
jgi:hypothetical protein